MIKIKHTKHLKKDKILGSLIKQFGEVSVLTKTENLYVDILESIVSQQLSVKASDTIWERFAALFGLKKITPANVLLLGDETIRGAGISYSKIKYMKGLSKMILDKETDLDRLFRVPRNEVMVELIKVKGIGPWTAEMILMFSLGDEDMFSMGDLGLRTAISKLYGVDRENLKEIEKITDKWSPYRTYASRYLWMSLDNEPKTSKT